MSRHIVLSAALVLVALPTNIFAQAAAESALTHSAAGTAASNLSSHIGNTLNQKLNEVSDRLQQQLKQSSQGTPPARPKRSRLPIRTPQTSTVSSTPAAQLAPTSATGQSVIASIQGGIRCPPSTAGSCQIPTKRASNTQKSVINLGKQ